MSKLSETMVKGMDLIHDGKASEVKANTITALAKRELIFQDVTGAWFLTELGRAELGVPTDRELEQATLDRAKDVLVDEIVAELDKGNPWNVTDETPESDQTPDNPLDNMTFVVPNRADRRNLRKSLARHNRRKMIQKGKRIKKFGPDSPDYFTRKGYTLAA